MTEYLFSYGTLQKDKVQLDLFGRLLKGRKDKLRGYKASVIEITDTEFLAKGDGKYQQIAMKTNDRNDAIEGTVFEVSEEELHHADKYEPGNYTRVKIELESGTKAWIYMAV